MIDEFLKALHGERGELDAWLECNDEAECRAAMLGAIEAAVAAERESCKQAVLSHPMRADKAFGWLVAQCAHAIEKRSNML